MPAPAQSPAAALPPATAVSLAPLAISTDLALEVSDEQMSRYLGLGDDDDEALALANAWTQRARAGAGYVQLAGTGACASSSSSASAAPAPALQAPTASMIFQPNPITLYEIKSMSISCKCRLQSTGVDTGVDRYWLRFNLLGV